MWAVSTATITVAEASGPGPGKKQGVVVDSTGEKWGYFPDKVGPFQVGAVYAISYTEREWQGRTFKTITQIKLQSPPAETKGGGQSKDRLIFMEVVIKGWLDRIQPSDTAALANCMRSAYDAWAIVHEEPPEEDSQSLEETF